MDEDEVQSSADNSSPGYDIQDDDEGDDGFDNLYTHTGDDDDDTPPDESESTSESTPTDAEVEDSTQSSTSAPDLPPLPIPDMLTDKEVEALKANGWTDEMLGVMGLMATRAVQRMEGAMLQSASLYEQAMVKYPDYQRTIGPRIRQHLATTVPQQTRHTQEGLNSAMALALLDEANATQGPDGFLKAVVRHAQLANGATRANTPPAPKTPTQRPTERTPNPSVSTSSGRPRSQNLLDRGRNLLGTNAAAMRDIFEDN